MERQNSCVLCSRSVLRRRKHILTVHFLGKFRDHVELLLQEITPREIPFDGSRSICHACWVRLDSTLRSQHRQNEPPQRVTSEQRQQAEDAGEEPNEGQQDNTGFISVQGYSRASNTARRCLFQTCRNIPTHILPLYVKFYVLHTMNFYIPPLARVCHSHLQRNDWEELTTQGQMHQFNGTHVLDMMNLYKWGLERRNQLDFENINSIDDNELHFWTGITKNQFNTILQLTPSLHNRTDRPAATLGIYLTKIRTGEPDERLATKFQMSRRTLERKIRLARECLTQDFVPHFLGLDHITREEAVARNLCIPSHIFGGDQNTVILVLDGTYLYVQKSSNFLFQRITYSLHKFRNLVKPFLIVCTDGYILDVLGPYAATTSDATIMRTIMEHEDSPWHWFLRPNDVFILDRGFRDSISSIQEFGYNPQMPPSRSRGEQLTTEEANKSRLITMTRWVVETMNSRFKKDFKIFRHTYFNVSLPNMMVDFRITAALINATRRPYEDSIFAEQFINIINENINRRNELAEYVREHNLNMQRVAFTPIDASDAAFDFPQLSYDDLTLFTLGSYHLRIARSYVHEQLRPNGLYIVELYRHQESVNNRTLIRGRIQSRHIRSKKYYTYILVNPTTEGRESIEDYYCSCIHGRRTIGCCAHIASMVYFLSWARHQEQIDTPARFLDDTIVPVDIDHVE
ncbi:uncharacterized protein LOC123667489 [Melitaea cinxia]|uniref:uncharacterized protein LOC123667489 n=1 Tax=Melitaea cinxia TaxID=113334 RepID=UPI001E26FB4B|nr:uncharacterized protein LOC123667489 [Melitaea cinxia]